MSSGPNGSQLRQRQMKNRAAWNARANRVLTMLQDLPLAVRPALLLTLLVLVTLCAGCATPSAPPSEGARNPQPPQLSEPLPSESYLQQVQKLIESWHRAVTDM